MTETFSFVPDRAFSSNTKPRTRSVKFGDGYEQRLIDGLNFLEKTWALSFVNRTNTDINAIITFLEDKGGTEFFFWAPPGSSTQEKVISETWKDLYLTDEIASLQVTFKKVFDP